MSSSSSVPTLHPTRSHASSGYAGDLDAKQRGKLEQLQARLEANGCPYREAMLHFEIEVCFLLRFLRHCKFDVGKAEAMLVKHVEWHRTFGPYPGGVRGLLQRSPHEVLGCDPALVNAVLPMWHIGPDLEHHPVTMRQAGHWNPAKCLEAVGGDIDRLVQYHVYCSEKSYMLLEAASETTGNTLVEQFCTIIDVKGVTMKTALAKQSLDVFKAINTIDAEHYPERVASCFVVNAPGWASFAWRVMKVFVDPNLRSRVAIKGSKCLATLKQAIDVSVIPGSLGGDHMYDGSEGLQPSLYLASSHDWLHLEYKPLVPLETTGAGGAGGGGDGGGERKESGKGEEKNTPRSPPEVVGMASAAGVDVCQRREPLHGKEGRLSGIRAEENNGANGTRRAEKNSAATTSPTASPIRRGSQMGGGSGDGGDFNLQGGARGGETSPNGGRGGGGGVVGGGDAGRAVGAGGGLLSRGKRKCSRREERSGKMQVWVEVWWPGEGSGRGSSKMAVRGVHGYGVVWWCAVWRGL